MADLIVGRRAKWVVAIAWVVAVGIALLGATRFQDAQQNDPASYQPGNAESSRVLSAVRRISGAQAATPAVVVFARRGGLQARDLRTIEADRTRLNNSLPRTGARAPAAVRSRDGRGALLIFGLRVHSSNALLASEVLTIKRAVRAVPPGLAVKVAGPAGAAYDASRIFQTINGTLLLFTVGLIFVLLILMYRSPIFWFIPVLAVGFAEIAAEGIGYLLTRVGVTATGESAAILTVLVFGAGTDYALLLVSRYREELYRTASSQQAMGTALRRAAPVVLASGFTVILGLLCLLAAEGNGPRGLGPIAAVGVIAAMASGLTLLPALLVIAGRRVFWPFIPHFRDHDDSEQQIGAWRRIARRVDGRPRPIALAVTGVLVVMCLGLLALDTGLTSGNSFTRAVESQQGQAILAAHFPAGASEPAEVVVTDSRLVPAVRVAMSLAPGVASGPLAIGPVTARGRLSVFDVTLAADPSSQRAFDTVGSLRRAARATAGTSALVGGPSAEEVDLRAAASRDEDVIVPMIVVVVFLILGILLRSAVAPVLLIVTVLLSYGAALGTGAFLFKYVFGYPGEDPSLELFTFLFLVALGVDYNVFLMARVREEALALGTRAGAVRALAVTGPVITSAGVVLAGSFSALASLPLIGLTELGFVIAFGVLLDTFLVRTVLVPALVIEFDRRIWWPSSLSRPALAGPAAPRRRRFATALVVAAAAVGGLFAIAISRGGAPGGGRPATARSGALTLSYGPPWRPTRQSAPGSFALAGVGAAASSGSPASAPVSLGSGRASLAAGRLEVSARVPGGVPPALFSQYGRPLTQATIGVGEVRARRYSWQLHDGRVLVARVIPTSGSDLAILCSSAKADLAAGRACAGVAARASVNGVAVLPPGPDPKLGAGLLAALKPVAAIRDRLGALATPVATGAGGLATLATQTAQLEQVAATGLSGLPLPARNRSSVTGLEAALRGEAGRLEELAGVIAREPEQFSETRARVILSSVRVDAAYRSLLADGFGLPPLLELGTPAAAGRAARAASAQASPPNRSSTRMLVVGPI